MTMIATGKPHLRVRSGPGADFREIGQIMPGTPVVVEEKAPGESPWVYVQPFRGWVHSGYLAEPVNGPPKDIGGPGWQLAPSLERLVQQVNAMAPLRSRTHDGTIGDAAHRARKSDHNPNPKGVVTALDITNDPANGCDCRSIADRLVASRDPRIKYLIFRGQIVSALVHAWAWRPYDGPNKHMQHLHISVGPESAKYEDARPWSI